MNGTQPSTARKKSGEFQIGLVLQPLRHEHTTTTASGSSREGIWDYKVLDRRRL
jgi:hypothetical protein